MTRDRKGMLPVGRLRAFVSPRRVVGWRAGLLVVAIGLIVVLASFLLWLGLAPDTVYWRLVAFSLMFYGLGLWALGPLLPSRFFRPVLYAGLLVVVAAVVWLELLPGK